MSGKTIKLSGQWLFKTNEKGKFSRKMNIPSNWETAGLHDYSGAVFFQRKFRISKENKNYILRFKGVDYFADVWLNGKYLGNHEGYFQAFEFNVTKYLNFEKQNILVVKVNSPIENQKDWPHEKQYIKGVFGHHDVRPGGWSKEFGQMQGTGGIWNDVELVGCDELRISDIKIRTPNKIVGVAVKIINYTNSAVVSSVVVKVRESRKSKVVSSKLKKVRLKPGKNIINLKLRIKTPKLWWCWDQGEPNLYEAEIDVEGSRKSVKFGIRTIKKDSDGNWVLNNRRIFIRGSNIIPEEYLSTYSKKRIEKDVRLIKSANINAIRIHAHVNRKELYEACDEAGILVWQDFALQWEYKDNPKFRINAVKQIKDMVNLLYNHPSIVLWCCHNEPIKSKKKTDKTLFKTVKSVDNTRITMLSSDFSEHPYPGWFWGKKEYFISLPGGKMPSEFGAMALPNLKTLKKMFNKKDLWPPNWLKWAKKNFAYDQMFHVAKVSKGKSIKEFIGNSQNYQAELTKFVIENYRQKKFTGIAGLFHFLFLEPWPCISYSVLDYFRRPKNGFYALQKAYQPILPIANFNRDTYGIGRSIEAEFFVINDLNKDFKKLILDISLRKNNVLMKKFRKTIFNLEKSGCKYLTRSVYSSTVGLKIPSKLSPGRYSLVFDISSRKKLKLSSNSYDIFLEKTFKGLEAFNAHFVWE